MYLTITKNWLKSIYFVFWISFMRIDLGHGDRTEQLYKELFQNYNTYVPPMGKDNSNHVTVNYGFEIDQIMEVKDREQTIKLKAWVRQTWLDERLKWEPEKWNNVTYVVYNARKLWLPDIVLVNNANEGSSFGADFYKTDLTIRYDGFIDWQSPVIFKSMCKLDIRYFPYDQHNCYLQFGSWIYDTSVIKLTIPSAPIIDPQSYFNSSEWELKKTWYENEETLFACCPKPFSVTRAYLTIKRKPLYYTFNVIAPCLVLVANIFIGFYLPPDCGERVGLTMTILLAVAVFLQLVNDTLPRNSDSIPLLGMFYILIMIESTFSLVTTCIVLVVQHHGVESNVNPMPRWLKRVFIDGIGKWLHVKRDGQKKNIVTRNDNVRTRDQFNNINSLEVTSKEYNLENVKAKNSNVDEDLKFQKIVKEIQKNRSLIIANEEGNEDEEIQKEWKYLGKILDRFFFWVLFILVAGTCCGLLIPAYYQYA